MKKWLVANLAFAIVIGYVSLRHPNTHVKLIKATPAELARWKAFVRELEDIDARAREVHDNILKDMEHTHGIDERSSFDYANGCWVCPITSES